MFDIFYISDIPAGISKIRKRFPLAKHATSLAEAKRKSFTKMFWAVWDDIVVNDDFNFDYPVSEWDQNYIHVFKNDDKFDGIVLIPKDAEISDREFKYRFFLNKKEIDIVASTALTKYDIFTIDSYDEYLYALENTTTEMFWMTSKYITPVDDFKFDIYYSKRTNEFYYERMCNHAFLHQEDGKETYDGIFLLSKHVPITKKEVEFRFPVDRKEWNIVASKPKLYDIFTIDSYDEYLYALENTTTEMFWMTSRNLIPCNDFKFDLYFSKKNHDHNYDRQHNHAFLHQEDGKETYDGIFLLSKHVPITKKEVEFRFPVDRKEWNIVASKPKLYDIFTIDSYDEYLYAMENAETEMFWMTSKYITPVDDFKFDLYFSKKNHDHNYDRQHNHAFLHQEDGKETYDGIFLLSKHVPITKKEVEFRFPVDRKEWNIVASKPRSYDIFTVDTYEEYLYAMQHAETEMFWMTSRNLIPCNDFKFDLYFSKKNHEYDYDREHNHAFAHVTNNNTSYDGIFLCSKKEPITKKEIEFRFLVQKKEHNIVASKHRPYDIVFISYNEPNADENYIKLQERFPDAKRVHKVKGIHNAHIEAAKLADTYMFWVVDGDAVIKDDFNFDYLVTRYERDIVHTWKSENPLNGLIYGYGGVKLLPRDLTIDMNIRTPDMTTAISKRFKLIEQVSNITKFNTDPFNTWKSAFRECVKLASKTIQGQIDAETEERLNVWCTVADGDYTIDAIRGARAGRKYGEENAGNTPALSKINNFNWLEKEFKRTSVLR